MRIYQENTYEVLAGKLTTEVAKAIICLYFHSYLYCTRGYLLLYALQRLRVKRHHIRLTPAPVGFPGPIFSSMPLTIRYLCITSTLVGGYDSGDVGVVILTQVLNQRFGRFFQLFQLSFLSSKLLPFLL